MTTPLIVAIDTCVICHKNLTIPVLPAQTCSCSQPICLFCFHDYFGISGTPIKTPTCFLGCGKLYKNLSCENLYTRFPQSELKRLDDKFGEMTCDCGWVGSRILFLEHEVSCSNIPKKCKSCDIISYNHIKPCKDCNALVAGCQKNNHLNFSCNGKKCESCNRMMSLHVSTFACEFCKKMVFTCPLLGKASHRCPEAIVVDGEKIRISDIKTKCHRCGLKYTDVNRHNDICVTLIDFMETLKIKNPYSESHL